MILKFHEVADIFSMMEGAELQRLADDIKANRQREPIWLHPDGSILDGRNRYRACGIAGTKQMAPPKYRRTYLDMKADELLLFRTISNRGNPEGRSIYRNAWRSWVFLKRIQEFEAIQ